MHKILSFLLLVFLIISCSKKMSPVQNGIPARPDYSLYSNWAAHPWQHNPSDSVPANLLNNYHKDSLADVFFLYPTSLIDLKDERWNAPVDDATINNRTDRSSILYQASAFSEKARVFAPRYRQANLKAYYSVDTVAAAKAFELAYEDVKSAFEYYLQHYNNNRPIIIASHSQGTTHAARLVKEFFEGKLLAKKLIAAYLIGMPVPVNYTSIPPCSDSLQTGCIVSWRTWRKGAAENKYIAKEGFASIVTNPLLWTNTDEYAPATLNKGGVLKNFNKIIPGVVDAQVSNKVLWVSKPKFFGNFLLRTKNYHIADINFFYVNISENVKTRIKMYQLNQ